MGFETKVIDIAAGYGYMFESSLWDLKPQPIKKLGEFLEFESSLWDLKH